MSNSDPLAVVQATAKPKLMPVPLVALLRGASLTIDVLSVAFLALLPVIYHQGDGSTLPMIGFNHETIELVTKSHGASTIGLLLAFTPLPVIYLRLIFKRVMKSPTLGEAIVGITSYAKTPGIEGATQELLYGLTQYVVTILAAIFACVATVFITMVPMALIRLLLPQVDLITLPVNFQIAIYASIYTASFISIVAFNYLPHSRTDITTYCDDYFQLEVKKLR